MCSGGAFGLRRFLCVKIEKVVDKWRNLWYSIDTGENKNPDQKEGTSMMLQEAKRIMGEYKSRLHPEDDAEDDMSDEELVALALLDDFKAAEKGVSITQSNMPHRTTNQQVSDYRAECAERIEQLVRPFYSHFMRLQLILDGEASVEEIAAMIRDGRTTL